MEEIRTRSLEEFNAFAARCAKHIAPHEDHATIIALSGELGAGKTTFVQEVARTLGIEEQLSSPTFVIEKIYELPAEMFDLRSRTFRRLVHIDAYRLNESRELEVLGWRDISHNPENLILIEWPERVPELIPEDATRIRFEIQGEERTMSINGSKKEGRI